jgi:hypothetical protein
MTTRALTGLLVFVVAGCASVSGEDPSDGSDVPQGGVYLSYDEAHNILYSSNWYGGVWRMTAP